MSVAFNPSPRPVWWKIRVQYIDGTFTWFDKVEIRDGAEVATDILRDRRVTSLRMERFTLLW